MQASAFAGTRLAASQATTARQQRQQLNVVAKDSRIGKVPVPVPDKVSVTLDGQTVKVKVRRHVTADLQPTMRRLGTRQAPMRGASDGRRHRSGAAAGRPSTFAVVNFTDGSPDIFIGLYLLLQGPRGELQRTFHPAVKFEQVRRPGLALLPGLRLYTGPTGPCCASPDHR